MIPLLFIGDGPRDRAMMPPIVATILGKEVLPEVTDWPRLHGAGKGYRKKLIFAMMQARSNGLSGVVATVDADGQGDERLEALRAGRADDRTKRNSMPTAIGCADPHAEAWLLDDPAAVRAGLGLEPSHDIPSVRTAPDPKQVLDELIAASPASEVLAPMILESIARELSIGRCVQGGATGLSAFAQDVRVELGHLQGSLRS